MRSSSAATAAADADSIASRCKRRDSRPPPLRLTISSPPRSPRSRKMKQKRLDAIRDVVGRPALEASSPLRRSTRSRRPAALIEPSTSPRRTRRVRDWSESREIGDGGGRGRDSEARCLRLRARGKIDGSSASSEKSKRRSSDDEVEFVMPGKRRKVVKIVDSDDEEVPDQPIGSSVVAGEDNLSLVCSEKLELSMVDAATVSEEDVVDGKGNWVDGEQLQQAVTNFEKQDMLKIDTIEVVLPICDTGLRINGVHTEDVAAGKNENIEEPKGEESDKRVGLEEPAANGDDGDDMKDGKLDAVIQNGDADSRVLEEGTKEVDDGNVCNAAGKSENAGELEVDKSGERVGKSKVREGRRCGLCGGGVDGKPPNEVFTDFGESENEAYELSPAEEPNYDMWDGFGDEPSWLGPLLGPTHDRFGIARIWVHQNCAVWSPEVYFAGFGRLKNVRAALSRGKVLKCSRCGRPGATIGCRVDRCPRTYHLPCARAKGSIFDHRKFLIGCPDHRHLFEPHGFPRIRKIRKLKAKKFRLQMRKLSNDASQKDFEAEEKWLENCGEDEEFLKREGKRLHRDLARIAPVYIGGDSLNDKKELYDGFESVAGLQDVIQCMKEVVILPLLYPEFFKTMGLTPPRGVLLHGYPGTGKTLVVRALIGACSRGDKRIAYFARKGADCLGKYVGDAERQLRLLFQVAERSQPSIIFFDEIDGLAPCRSRRQDQTHNSVVSTLLALLDGLKSRGSVMVIGATNRPDALDPALRRPGRFDREIYFPLPSVKDRASIMELHTKKWPKPVTGQLLKWISERTVGYAGADLQALCTQAVMMVLKRQCALQELMSAAENVGCSKCPPLPSVIVEESDWLAALALAPPPCSRREAATCANDVIFVPLQLQLSQCLMYPVTHLLLSMYLDERIWLPTGIEKASKLATNTIFTALEQKKVHSASWSKHLSCLLQESEIAKKIEGILCCTGLVSGYPYFSDSEALEYEVGDKMTCSDLKLSKPDFEQGILQSSTSGRMSGYRVLLTGKPKCGQQHVAACLLHGFIGYSKVVKVSFATIIQEGHGDVLQGITQILLRCMSVGRCIIYMPRIDLWAFEANEEPAGKDNLCSETWKSFVEQVDARGSSTSLIILATCETHISLPNRIKEFFTWCMGSSAMEYTIPRFFVHFDGKFDRDMFLSASTRNLSHELVKSYVQLIHQRTHASKSCNEFKECGVNNARSEVNVVEFLDKPADAVGEMKPVVEHSAKQPLESGVDLRPKHGQDLSSRSGPNKAFRGKSNVLHFISTFGCQLLRYPHFKELCWATSKLEGGPCADIGGTLKGWPFNTCFVRPKPVVDNESSGGRNKENHVVRGLVAIGLLACKGMYTSAREVLLDVRSVLELLVLDIDSRISAGKDKFNFFRLLAQVAYLDDMVISWAHALGSSEIDSQVITSNTNQGKWDARSTQIDHNDPKMKDEGMHIISSLHGERIGLSILKGSSPGSVRDSLECSKISECPQNGLSDGNLGRTVKNSTEVGFAASSSNMTNRGVGCRDPETLLASNVQLVDMDLDVLACQNGGDDLTIMAGSLDLHTKTSAISESFAESSQTSGNMIVEEKTRHFVGSLASDADNQTCAEPSQTPGNMIVEEETRQFVGSVASDTDNSYSSESLCRYVCCSQCVHKISEWLSVYISKRWESSGFDATIEGMHDVVETCSLNLLATVKASFLGENGTAESSDTSVKAKSSAHIKRCSCPHVLDSKEASKLHGTMPADCSCHPGCNKSLPDDPRLEFFFRDSTLVPSDQGHDSLLHCRYDSLCTCFAFASILASKQPSD